MPQGAARAIPLAAHLEEGPQRHELRKDAAGRPHVQRARVVARTQQQLGGAVPGQGRAGEDGRVGSSCGASLGPASTHRLHQSTPAGSRAERSKRRDPVCGRAADHVIARPPDGDHDAVVVQRPHRGLEDARQAKV